MDLVAAGRGQCPIAVLLLMGWLEPLLIALGLVSLAEVGDKSMVLGIVLAIRYRRPWPVFWGLVLGMSANLAIAASLGALISQWLSGDWLSWLLGLSFLGVAVWALFPGGDGEAQASAPQRSRGGVFLTAAAGYFLLEMADRTQVATLSLAARYEAILPVLGGAVLGVVLVNAPAIWLGHRFAGRLPVRMLRRGAAVLFGLLGVWILLEGPLSG